MAKITRGLFSWQDVEGLGDLKRLHLVLDALPDEALMRKLEAERGKGRDDYPIRAVFNSLLAGIVFGHESVESLRRELLRNAQLRHVCGFDVVLGARAVPPPWVYTRFLKRLIQHAEAVQEIFHSLTGLLCEALPDFGEVLAVDGKAISTHARARNDWGFPERPDGRRDTDADWGVKRKRFDDGGEHVSKWFGYKLHLVADATYELPVAFEVTRASEAEQPQAQHLMHSLGDAQGELVDRCEVLLGDKGYDSGKLHAQLWQEHRIKPVIDIRKLWPENVDMRPLAAARNVFYTETGQVHCCCMNTGRMRQMAYGGFEKDRGTLKYRCPAKHYGARCASRKRCPVRGAIRISLDEDRRIFTPIARPSRRWEALYAKRTAIERVNSRLDVSFGFERHFIRGLRKMWLRCALSLIVMQAMALGRIKEKQRDKMRSLVQAA